MRQTLSVLVENRPGVLTRVAGLFYRRDYNIHSLAVGVTENPQLSRMTIVIDGHEETLEQVAKQLNKLVNVIKVQGFQDNERVARELALIKIDSSPTSRSSIIEIAEVFRGRVVDVGKTSMIIEITGDGDKVDALLEMLGEYGIREIVRTGLIAVSRGERAQQYNQQKARR